METDKTFGPHVTDPIERKAHKENIRKALTEKITPFQKLILWNLDFSRSGKLNNTAK